MDPNPYKSPGLLMARIRSRVEPQLLANGFQLTGRNPRHARQPLYCDYERAQDLLSISWSQRTGQVVAEYLSEGGRQFQSVASVMISGARCTRDIDDRLAVFFNSLCDFVERLPKPPN